jgi:cystine transport system substrate-binding protein
MHLFTKLQSLTFSKKNVLLSITIFISLLLGVVSPSFAEEGLLKQIKTRGLNVGLEATYPPFNFYDKNGNLVGFEIDFANALAAQLGVKINFQPTKWDGLLAALESKRIDVVINQVTITQDRKKKYDFSTPYTYSGMQILAKKDMAATIHKPTDLNGKTIGVGLGTDFEAWLKKNVPQAIVKTYDDDPTKYQDLRNGRIDAIMVSRLAALDFVKRAGDTNLALAGEPFVKEENGIALRKNNEDLLKAINQAIDTLQKNGTLKTISQRWFGQDLTQPSK